MKTSEVLYAAADLIDEHGWTDGPAGMLVGAGPKCLEGAIQAAVGAPRRRDQALKYHYVDTYPCPAGAAVKAYLNTQTDLFVWNDQSGRTADEVTAVLRAAAVIEAAREEAADREQVSA